MKLFVFRPVEYGPDTYIVMAENEEIAKMAVKQFYEKQWAVHTDSNHKDHTEYGAIESKTYDGKDMYEVENYEANQVATNANG